MTGLEQALKAKREVESMQNELTELMQWSKKQKQRDEAVRSASKKGDKRRKDAVDAAVTRSIDAFARSPSADTNQQTSEQSAATAPSTRRSGFSFKIPDAGKQAGPSSCDSSAADASVKTRLSSPQVAPRRPNTPDQNVSNRPHTMATKPDLQSSVSPAAATAQSERPVPAGTNVGMGRQAEADQHRERGNELFRKGAFEQARSEYSTSVRAFPGALAYANRAMVNLKLEQWALAEDDATAAIELDAKYGKALQRRAAARLKMGSLEKVLGAVEDLERALLLHPTSASLAAERAAAIAQYHKLPGSLDRPSIRTPVQVVDCSSTTSTGTSSLQQQQQQQQQPMPEPKPMPKPETQRQPKQQQRKANSPTLQGTRPEEGPSSVPASQQERTATLPALLSGCQIEEVEDDATEKTNDNSSDEATSIAGEGKVSRNARQLSTGKTAPPVASSFEVLPSTTPQTSLQDPSKQLPNSSANAVQASAVHSNISGAAAPKSPDAKGATNSEAAAAAAATEQSKAAAEAHIDAATAGSSTSAGGHPDKDTHQEQTATSTSGPALQSASASGQQQQQQQKPATVANRTLQSSSSGSQGAAASAPAHNVASPAEAGASADVSSTARLVGSAATAASIAELLAKMTPPRTGAEFERSWRTLAAHREQQAAYLALISPSTLPSLLRTQLTAPLLESLLPPLLDSITSADITKDPKTAAHALELLAALSKVPRFTLAAMAIPPSRRRTLSAKWDTAITSVSQGGADISSEADSALARLKPLYLL